MVEFGAFPWGTPVHNQYLGGPYAHYGVKPHLSAAAQRGCCDRVPPPGERDVGPLYQLGTAETLRRLLKEEYDTAVADTSTVVAGWSLRHLAGSSAPPRGAALPAAPRRPPSSPPPHYGAGAGSSSQALYGAETGPSANPPTYSGAHYDAPEEDRSQDNDPGYGTRPLGVGDLVTRVTKRSLCPPPALCVARCRPSLRGGGAVFLSIDWSRAP